MRRNTTSSFHHSRRHRPRQIVETLRRHEDDVSEIRLRGHGRRAVPPDQGRPRHKASAARDRQFDGRGAPLDVGREKSPKAMDALVPMASQPTEMASRNWMLRRMMLETIRNDPDYNGGNYTAQPRMMKYAINAYGIATGGGTLAYQMLAPTAAKADKMVDDRLATVVTADANDFIYQWEASHDYNPSAGLERIEAVLLLINAADDERNPPETGITDAAMKRVKNGRLYLIPASTETRGHLTTGDAAFYQQQIKELLQTAPQRTM